MECEPEEVLVRYRISSHCRIEKARYTEPVRVQHDKRCCKGRYRDNYHDGRNKRRHTKNDGFMSRRFGWFILRIVSTKFIAARNEKNPSIFNPKIQNSAAGPGALVYE